MQHIRVDVPAWLNTFPHRVIPLPDEWFPGLLLRCDEANHWDSGRTLAHLLRSIPRTLLRGQSNWVIVPISAVECLAQLLAISARTLLATTYQVELARLYGTATPHASQLSTTFSFHLCAECLAETRLLRRILILPHLTLCPLHRLTLINTCRCGAQLHPFSRTSAPFTCQRCSADWATLPRMQGSVEQCALERKMLSYYTLFLAEGTPLLLERTLQLVRTHLKQRKDGRVKRLDGSIKQVEHYELTKASLGYLVDLLVSLNLAPWDAR